MLVGAGVLAGTAAPPDRVALDDGRARLTFGELADRARAIRDAAAAWERPARRPADLVLLGRWTPEYLAAFLGLSAAGWAVGVLDPDWTDAELQGAIAQVDPVFAVAEPEQALRLGTVSAPAPLPGAWVATPRAGGAGERPRPPDADTHFYVGFTSGSSGVPKAFARAHGSWCRSFARLRAYRPPTGGRVVVPGPLSGSHFLFCALYALEIGAGVRMPGGDRASLASLADGCGPDDAIVVVPSMLAGLGPGPGHGGPGTVFCAGARLEAAVLTSAARRLPRATLVEYYGASELSFVAIRTTGDGTPPGSVGRAFPGVEIQIRDAGGLECAAGQEGTIAVRSDLVFDGYRGASPDDGARDLGDGWLTVGDRGRLDAGGHLWVHGRGSSVIVTGGANVQPEEVEEAVAAIPGVLACVVVGIPDPRWGEVVCAAVAADGDVRRADLRAGVRPVLARYKRPRRYLRWDGPFPTVRTGKIDRDRVRRAVLAAGPDRELR